MNNFQSVREEAQLINYGLAVLGVGYVCSLICTDRKAECLEKKDIRRTFANKKKEWWLSDLFFDLPLGFMSL